MQRDWADNLYPGPTNSEGRRLLEEHLAAMFDLETEQPPLVELDGRLILEAQKTLARLSVAQRAYELLKSEARSVRPSATGSSRAKAAIDVASVFEATGPSPLDRSACRPSSPINGFHERFIAKLGNLVRAYEAGSLGAWRSRPAGRAKSAIRQSRQQPARSVRQRLHRRLAQALAKLKMKKLLADKPKYQALRAVSAPTSPLRLILESIKEETTADAGASKAGQFAANRLPRPDNKARNGCRLLFNTQDGPPGAKIEEQFKPYHAVLEGDSTRRPIDSVIGNLNDIAQSLTLMIENPMLVAQATALCRPR
jgi:type VI secretion system protein ImpL